MSASPAKNGHPLLRPFYSHRNLRIRKSKESKQANKQRTEAMEEGLRREEKACYGKERGHNEGIIIVTERACPQ